MKKFFSLFGLGVLLLFSFAFTSVELVLEEVRESGVEADSEVCFENTMMFGTGRFYSCAVVSQSPPPGSIIYRLSSPTGAYQDLVDCESDLITLPPGTYDLYVLSTAIQAYVYCQWEFCGNEGVVAANVGPSNQAVFMTQILIPC